MNLGSQRTGCLPQPLYHSRALYSLPWNSRCSLLHCLHSPPTVFFPASLLRGMTSPPTSLGKLRTSDENSHSFLPSSCSFLWIITQTFLLPSHLGRNVPCHMDRLTPSPASHHAGLPFRDHSLSFVSAGDLHSSTTWVPIFSLKDKQTHLHQPCPCSATLHVS